ncbi:MAG: DUF445 family protein [Proteobacteria bacterium]|nr:DUF445 family protein [Pseudomonadota bacterium]
MTDVILLFLTVPVITALIGWGTNWAAVKMIFHPIEFTGMGPLGWQGILYKQSHKFATNVADMATKNLLTARELMSRFDLDEIEQLFAETFDAEVEQLCREAAEIIQPGAWDNLPDHVTAVVVAQVKARTRSIARELFVDIETQAEEFVDLHELVYTQLSGANVGRLAEFTMQIGRKEFKFIEYYGGVFGFIIGLAQITVWTIMQKWWLMPVVGIMVGLVTNWLAIQMIFRPQEPKKYFGLVTYQGLFAKRQPEIAADYGRVAGEELLTPKNLIEFVTRGPNGPRLALLVTQTLSARIDEEWKKIQPMVPVPVSEDDLAKIKGAIVTRIMQIAPTIQSKLETYLTGKLGVRETVENRLATLPKHDFERVLRGIFEEDEITLILVGGFLGGCVGVAQGMLVLTMYGV